METFRFLQLRFRRAYDSPYDSDFWFSLGYKRFFTTPLTIPTQTPSLLKASLYTKNTVIIIIIIIIIININHLKQRSIIYH